MKNNYICRNKSSNYKKMKNFKFMLIMIFALVLNACSSNSDPAPAPTTTPVNTAEYFNYKIDGETISVTQWQSYRVENSIEVLGTGSNGKSIFINFNSAGNIGRANTYSAPGSGIPRRETQANYTNQSFTFNLVAVDDVNKLVKGTFSGKVYENGYDLTSPFVLVEGDFQVKYTQVAPAVAGLGVYAKIAGDNWTSSKGDSTGGILVNPDLTLHYYNGGVYRIGITINPGTLTTAPYPYTPTSAINKVVLAKYNTTTKSFDDYNCTGSFNVTGKVVSGQKTIITGIFSFTATDPATSTPITVSNGTFKSQYSN